MKYAIIDNGSIIAHGSAAELWPDTSFANGIPNQSFLEEVGAVEIGFVACDPATETVTPCQPYLLDGEVFDTVATVITSPSVETLKEQVNAERVRRKDALTVTMDGTTFDADDVSRDNLVGVMSAVSAGVPVSFPHDWRDADNVTRPLSQTQLITLAGMMMISVKSLYDASWELKDVTIPGLSAEERRSFDVTADEHWQ